VTVITFSISYFLACSCSRSCCCTMPCGMTAALHTAPSMDHVQPWQNVSALCAGTCTCTCKPKTSGVQGSHSASTSCNQNNHIQYWRSCSSVDRSFFDPMLSIALRPNGFAMQPSICNIHGVHARHCSGAPCRVERQHATRQWTDSDKCL
jgi:hypothetical protein